MRFDSVSFMAVAASLSASSAFVIAPNKAIQKTAVKFPTQLFSDATDPTEEAAAAADNKTPKAASTSMMEPGSHEELMYALGVNLARQLGDVKPLVESGEELAGVAKGLLDAVVGRLDEEGQRILLASRGKELNNLITDRANNIRQKLEDAGREMLKGMAETEECVVLDSGVVLHVLEPGPEGPGNGVRPTKSSTVKLMYHGTLADGTVFDSSLSEKEPIKLPVAGVIQGWQDGLLKMHEGETAMLGIPPELAYGPEGTPDGRVPGGSTLFFKVQLMEVMTAGINVGGPTLLGADGQSIKKNSGGSGLLGADGKPMG